MKNLIIIKSVKVYIDEKGTAFLSLEDVARGLGFITVATSGNEVVRWQRVRKYLIDLKVIDAHVDSQGNVNLPEFIPENIFYKLCMKANNETARKFQDLVCDEILPTIRKTGGYIATSEKDTNEDIMAKALLIAQKTIENKNNRIEKLEIENKVKDQQILEMQPKVSYYDLILQCKSLLSTTSISKDYGMSATEFNKLLHNLGVQYSQSGVWFLYQKYADKGYTQTKTHNYSKSDGTQGAKPHTYWTQKGRLFLYDFLKKHGYLPTIEREEN